MKKPSPFWIVTTVFLLITIGFISRILPHTWNATPIGAITLFTGFLLGWRYAILIPFLTMLLSDLWIGTYQTPIMFSVYLSFISIGFLGIVLRKNQKYESFLAGGIIGATIFFLLTNGAVWWFSGMYPQTLYGLFTSYIAGLPVYKNMLIGDIFYVSIFYGIYQTALHWSKYDKKIIRTLNFKVTEKLKLIKINYESSNRKTDPDPSS